MVKECEEEASVPHELAQRARSVGAVSYATVSDAGYKPDVLFCYDLRLPDSFVPKPMDGEVRRKQRPGGERLGEREGERAKERERERERERGAPDS